MCSRAFRTAIFPGGRLFRRPSLMLAMLYYRLRDLSEPHEFRQPPLLNSGFFRRGEARDKFCPVSSNVTEFNPPPCEPSRSG